MREITYAEAMIEALYEILESDERVHIFGGTFFGLSPRKVLFDRIQKTFPRRVTFTPISELGYCGIAIGAAMSGLRSIVDISTASFIFNAWPQIVNEAANAHYMTGGQTKVPAVFHMLHGIRGGGAPQHSHSPQAMLWNTPGLEIMLPASPRDVKGLLKTAARRENPVIFVNHVKLFELTGPVPDGDFSIPFGQADIKRAGKDVTVVATSFMVQRALRAAQQLVEEGVDVEVVDPRTLVPLDKEAIVSSVVKTGRVLVVDEGHRSAGVAAELSAILAEDCFTALKKPIRRVTTPDVPISFSQRLEAYIEPNEEKIVAAVLSMVK